MEKIANSSTLRGNLSGVLDEVQFNMDSYIIERKGKPAAALVPLSVYENWKRSRQELIDLITSFQEASGDNDPDEIMEVVLEAQQAVRVEIAKERKFMRVVLDANIYVSSLLSSRGNAAVIVTLWLHDKLFDVCISAPIIEEVEKVIRYPRIRKIHTKTEQELSRFIELIQEHATWIETTTFIDIASDKSDNRYIECAVDSGASYLVTGDKKHLLPIGEYLGIKIVLPATFLTLLRLDN